MNIRFISIQEGLDTIDPKCPAIKMLPFYFVFNEWHSQSTSEKIRAVFQNQAQQGKHRSYHAPYGYNKDSVDKYKLVIDPIYGVGRPLISAGLFVFNTILFSAVGHGG